MIYGLLVELKLHFRKGATIVSIVRATKIMELLGDRFFEFMGLKPHAIVFLLIA